MKKVVLVVDTIIFCCEMCILFIYSDPSPQKGSYRLIIASNRDEYYQRPAQCAFLCPQYNVIGGRDMESGRKGGMWLGVSLNKTDSYKFRFGALLNVTGEERKEGVEGRGPIVANYLKTDVSAKDYIQTLQDCSESHNAYNFVAVELSNQSTAVFYQSNTPKTCLTFEDKQILGFGNSAIAIPLVKVNNGKDRFAKIVAANGNPQQKELLISELITLLKWQEKHLPDPELQRRSPAGFEFLSSIYVRVLQAGYGTRAHSIVLVDDEWNVEFIEAAMEEPINSENPTWQTHHFNARL